MKKHITILFAILFITYTAFAQVSFQLPFTISNGSITKTLKLGVNPGNSIGIDTASSLGSYREVPAPPTPPAPFDFDARFVTIPNRSSTFPIGLAGGVMNDYRGYVSATQVDTFKIKIDGDGTDNNETTVTWPTNIANYANAWVLKPQTGTSWPETNMLQHASLVIPAGGNKNILIIKTGAKITAIEDHGKIQAPAEFALEQNYPNPFNPSTVIRYSVAAAGKVQVTVYNSIGQAVATLINEVQPVGNYHVSFNGKNLSSGIYFYQLKTNEFVQMRKMILVK